MEEAVSIAGVDPAKLLLELVTNTITPGIGAFVAIAHGRFTLEQAKEELDRRPGPIKRFDYVAGRPIKITIDTEKQEATHVWLYDRDAGAGAFAQVLEAVKAQG